MPSRRQQSHLTRLLATRYRALRKYWHNSRRAELNEVLILLGGNIMGAPGARPSEITPLREFARHWLQGGDGSVAGFCANCFSNLLTRRSKSGRCCKAIHWRLAWRSGWAGDPIHFVPSGMFFITPDLPATRTRLPMLIWPIIPTWPASVT